jgi:ribosomal protein S18 acetylase RimI-like enzyme
MKLYADFVVDDRYTKPDSDSFEQVIDSPSNFVFIAANDEKLIGFASFSIRRVIRYPTPIAELDELYVGPAFRDHGIAKL